MKTLNTVIANILNVDAAEFVALVEDRGMRPVKAAIRLGAEGRDAQLFAALKIAKTAEEITSVYANDKVKSCMLKKDVGPFYEANGISVIYSDNYRILVNMKTETLCASGPWSGYGFHRDIITPKLLEHFKGKKFINNLEYTTKSIKVGTKEIFTPKYEVLMRGWSVTNIKKGEENIRIWDLGINELAVINRYLAKNRSMLNGDRPVSILISNVGLPQEILITLEYGKKDRTWGVKSLENILKLKPGHFDRKAAKLKKGKDTEKFQVDVLETTNWSFYEFLVDIEVSICNTVRHVDQLKVIPVKENDIKIPRGCYVPYFDFEFKKEIVKIPEIILTDEEVLEEHYWKRLGDSVREPKSRPRTNY